MPSLRPAECQHIQSLCFQHSTWHHYLASAEIPASVLSTAQTLLGNESSSHIHDTPQLSRGTWRALPQVQLSCCFSFDYSNCWRCCPWVAKREHRPLRARSNSQKYILGDEGRKAFHVGAQWSHAAARPGRKVEESVLWNLFQGLSGQNPSWLHLVLQQAWAKHEAAQPPAQPQVGTPSKGWHAATSDCSSNSATEPFGRAVLLLLTFRTPLVKRIDCIF